MFGAMADMNHWMGGDLGVSPVGDVAAVSGTDRGRQRVLRRLSTNPGAYVFQPEYGAGLGRYVGSTVTAAEVQALVQAHLALEPTVAQTPAPQVTVTQQQTAMSILIQYTDAPTGQAVVLGFEVGEGM